MLAPLFIDDAWCCRVIPKAFVVLYLQYSNSNATCGRESKLDDLYKP